MNCCQTSGIRRVLAPGLAALLVHLHALAGNLGPLGDKPDWQRLDPYQLTITRDEFVRALDTIYAPAGAAMGFIEAGADSAWILRESDAATPGWYELRFAPDGSGSRVVPANWKPADRLGSFPSGRPLSGARIAVDPGHIGGSYARIEERWFRIGSGKPVAEGDLTLAVARLLARRLEDLGANVTFVRNSNFPATGLRPRDLRTAAIKELRRRGVDRPARGSTGAADPLRPDRIQRQCELLFYRTAEIRARAIRVNRKLEPDLVLALHFNAEDWGHPRKPRLIRANHLHVLVNGAYTAGEIALDDVRFNLLLRLLQGIHDVEIPAANSVASAMAGATGLPPYRYIGSPAIRPGGSPYVYARNLLANRLYECPVVYLEPYVMNSVDAYARIQAGDYEGVRTIAGASRPSIFQEYADSVAAGLADYYARQRLAPETRESEASPEP